jgi:tRNA threonylcarbamoyladenosine biosynthesis protein TsaE
MRIRTHSEQETETLGRRLAAARPALPVAPVVLYLQGELGSGKTTFVRGFARGAGVASLVRSPTYTLLELYPGEGCTLVHLDLYRLRSSAELESLGLAEWAIPGHVWLIEWPEQGEGRLPSADLTVSFSAGPDSHDVEAAAGSALAAAWLVQLETALRTP